MRQLFYKFIYSSSVNLIYRNILRSVRPNKRWFKKIPVSGNVIFHINGKKFKVATNQTSYTSRRIFWDGIDEFEYVPIFRTLVKKVNTFIDIGANTGLYSTLGALENPELKVWGFEPSLGPFTYFEENIKLNKFENQVKAYPIALSNETGKAIFYELKSEKYKYLNHNLGGVGNLVSKVNNRNMIEITVEVSTFDNFLKKHPEIKDVGLVKMDTEGAEDLVIKGMSQTIQKHRPIIITEVLFGKTEDELENLFQDKDYLFFNHIKSKNKLEKTPYISRNDDNGVRDMFLVPKEKLSFVSEFI